MAFRILSAERRITAPELAFLVSPSKTNNRPEIDWITEEEWRYVSALPQAASVFSQVISHMKVNPTAWRRWIHSDTPETTELPCQASIGVSGFQKLLLIRVFRLQRIREAIQRFIDDALGREFTLPPTLNLSKVFQGSNPLTPIIFTIMPGIDPQDEIYTTAASMAVDRYLRPYSLGRGRGKGAEELLLDSADRGFWVVLQNCHLSLSWMPRLEQLVSSLHPQKVHRRFRLLLVTMSSESFPIGLLYESTKLVYEIPKGMRENVLRIYNQIDPDEYQTIDPMAPERMMLFKLSVFHSVILERLQFGSLGWNLPYEFNPSDFIISRKQMKTLLTESIIPNEIPYPVLSYVIGELNYGGRITDQWDRRTLLAILDHYFVDQLKNSLNSRYPVPYFSSIYQHVIDTLASWPLITEGSEIGLGSNASAITARNEVLKIFSNLIEVQPTIISNSESVNQGQFEICTVENLIMQVPSLLNIVDLKKRIRFTETLNVVLYHEILLYNKLLSCISESLKQALAGLKGLLVIDDSLELLIKRLVSDRVPETWLDLSFPSILALKGYIDDLTMRVDFIDRWARQGPPGIFKLGAFYHPEEFLTAVLQTYARSHNVPFDSLRWTTTLMQGEGRVDEGVLIGGLVIEGAKCDEGQLVECGAQELLNLLPVVHLMPTQAKDTYDMNVTYECPVYRTQKRGTGALDLPNYVLSLYLPTPKQKPEHWIQRSVAAFITADK
jgi:hypothetical protein